MPRAKSSPSTTVKWKVELSNPGIGQEERKAVDQVLAKGWLSMGPKTEEFEEVVAKRLGVKHAVLVSSCTSALSMAVKSLGLGPGDEVICPSMTFVATANAIRHCGADPVLCDIESPEFPLIDLQDVASRLTPKTKALMIVHYGGFMPRMEEVQEFCRKHRLQLIEDAAHAIGASQGERPAGTFGALGCFSFFSNKNLVTGEGGLVVTNNATLARRLRLLRNHGITAGTWQRHNSKQLGYDVVALGHNHRPTEITAALALVQLKKLDDNNDKRGEIIEMYKDELCTESKVDFPDGEPETICGNHIMPILLPNSRLRDRVRQALLDGGIQVSHHYPPIHTFSSYRAKFRMARLPNTEVFARRELTLPLHTALKEKDVNLVVKAIKAALKNV